MNVRGIQRKAVFALAVLSVFSTGTSFAQEAQPLTKEEIRTGFIAGMAKVKSDYEACLQKLSLTSADVDALETEGEVTDPEVLLCQEERKDARSALLDEFKKLRAAFREQAKAEREQFVAEKKAAAEEKKVAAKEKAAEKKAAAEEKKAAAKEKGGKK